MSSEQKPDPTGQDGTIQISTRHDRSLFMFIIQMILRPFHNHVGRPGKKQPKGSITLKASPIGTRRCTVTHRTICDINVYDLQAKVAKNNEVKKRVYYFCGGGWQSPPSSQHWGMCAKMAQDMSDTRVSLVSYPLAPNNPAPEAFPWLMRFYREIMEMADEQGEKVILAGDSSGGNIVLSLILEALREDDQQSETPGSKRRPHPVAIFAICPSTDLTRSNPDIKKLEKDDPMLRYKFVKSTADRWRGDWDPADRRVTPANGDISLLAKYGIHVHGVTAGYDILSPDGLIFRKKLQEHGVQGQWLHWEKQIHCFVLTYPYGIREAKEGVEWVLDVLNAE